MEFEILLYKIVKSKLKRDYFLLKYFFNLTIN